MSSHLDIHRLARVATLSMALSAPSVATALAEELYHPGQYDAFGADQANAPLNAARRSQQEASPSASSASTDARAAANSRALDLTGSRDSLERVYNEIYRPGSRPPGW